MGGRRRPLGLRLAVEALRQAAASGLSHPLRSALGALAVAVAVAASALVAAALDGVAGYARETTARTFGADTFVLARIASPGSLSRQELAEKQQRNRPLHRSDERFLERYAEAEVVYAASAQRRADVVFGSRKFEGAAVVGTAAELAEIRDLPLSEGRFLSPLDDQSAAQVAVLGADVAEELFPGLDPLGRRVRLAGRGFLVVGVQTRQGTAAGSSLDRYVFLPLTAFERALGVPETLDIYARAAPGRGTTRAEDRARVTLRARRRLQPGTPDDFDLLSPEAARGFVASLSERVGAATGPITFMALLAALTVVVNTSLVSVAERTREIGVRRALGAKRWQIALETLAESGLVALAGGAGGLVAAVTILGVLAPVLPVPLEVSPRTVALQLAAAGITGLIAGLYPARNATRVEIVAALRSE